MVALRGCEHAGHFLVPSSLPLIAGGFHLLRALNSDTQPTTANPALPCVASAPLGTPRPNSPRTDLDTSSPSGKEFPLQTQE